MSTQTGIARHPYNGKSKQCSYQYATSVRLCNLGDQQRDRGADESDAKACDDSAGYHLAEVEG